MQDRPTPAPPPEPTPQAASFRRAPDPPPRKPRRRKLLLVALILGALLALDLARPPEDQLTARTLLAAIDAYQASLSPLLGRAGVRCRFRPSCSHYAEGAIKKDGALIGSLRAAWRIARCGPWTPVGAYDPP